MDQFDEFGVILKARRFIADAGVNSVPIEIEKYASIANARIEILEDLDDEESGQVFPLGGKYIIAVNGRHREERQRFTVLHEIAHIVLELPSQHYGRNVTTSDILSYQQRPREEILCDVFAAECLLPYSVFKKDIDDLDVSLDALKELANQYKASVTSTGSRFAANCDIPCAFVLMENDKTRYVSRSKSLRELNGWISVGTNIPPGSVAHRLIRKGSRPQDYDNIAADIWFNEGVKGFDLVAEETMLLREWNQCLSVIWLDESLGASERTGGTGAEEDHESALRELDGNLPWPKR